MARAVLHLLLIFHVITSLSLATHLPILQEQRENYSGQDLQGHKNESVSVFEKATRTADDVQEHKQPPNLNESTATVNYNRRLIHERKEKALVFVKESRCQVSGQTGACLPFFKCDLMGGQVKGSCEWGLGQCCVYQGSCGRTFSAYGSYFISGGDYTTPSSTCTFAVTPTRGSVCQLRLQLKQLELTPPNVEGVCAEDFLSIEGAVMPKLCQIINEQEVYVDVSALRPPFHLQVVTGASTAARRWNVGVEQIPCGDNRLAPTGCLLYSKAATGDIRSFNYDVTASPELQPNVNKAGSRHSPDSYMVCVKRAPGRCGLRWRSAGGEDGAFTVSGDFVTKLSPSVSRGSECTTDYLYFGNASISVSGQTEQTDRVCGYTFPDTLDTPSYSFLVVNNAVEGVDADFDNRGFHLEYEQLPC